MPPLKLILTVLIFFIMANALIAVSNFTLYSVNTCSDFKTFTKNISRNFTSQGQTLSLPLENSYSQMIKKRSRPFETAFDN